jgi:hypothetical protein
MLATLLEKCTAHRPYARPSMKEFATELRAWLDWAPPAKRQARHRPAIRTFGSVMEAHVHAEGITGVAQKCLIELLWAIDDRLAFEGKEQSPDDSRALLADEDLAGGNPDWVPEWGPEVRTLTWASRPSVRLVAALIGTNDDRGVYWVEWHTHDAGHWDLTWHSVSAESWLRMPTDWALRATLTDETTRGGPPLFDSVSLEEAAPRGAASRRQRWLRALLRRR